MQTGFSFDNIPAHLNQGLFADHFLEDPARLRDLAEWKEADGAEEVFQGITLLYHQHAVRFNKQTNEAQTEHDFIQPLLNLIWGGSCYQVQVTIPNVDGRRQPDYAFFRTDEERQAADQRKGTLEYWRDVPVLGDAKKWSASLDKQRGVGDNPSAQIRGYLYRSRVRWGILTNGRRWRLYEREKSAPGGIYYEVDLVDLLQRGDIEAFKYFYLFFRREAFVPDSSGRSFVEKVYQGSVDYATEVGGDLKESVYDALRLLMNGFFEYEANSLDRSDPDTVKRVHENSLIVLYRLLFLLYAEDRGLLPRHVEPYASYSLFHLQQEINQHLRDGTAYARLPRFWGEVQAVFKLIDQGFPEGGIPAYNGGLFSPENHPYVAHTPQPGITPWQVGDDRLAEVIDLLAYRRGRWDQPGADDIDYTTLEVHHLGSVYEGLLELQPQIATEPMVETAEKGNSVFKPAREVLESRPVRGQPPREIAEGEVYLVTNRGERKATGSYYTPTYIVDYIVEHTVGPLADEAARQVADLRPEIEKEIRKLKRKRGQWEKTGGDKAALQREKLDAQIETQRRRLLDPYLSLTILDPAMGSGHFLVGAADFLSLRLTNDPHLEDVLFEEMGDEDPQAYYKRLIVERCLYGVDLNPLTVELAKLSLWLHTVSRNKALSFLDHHLRCGNSLVGAHVEADLPFEPPRLDERGRVHPPDREQRVLGFTETLTAKHLHDVLDTFRRIVELPTGDAEAEREKDHLYRVMDAVRDRFRAVANGWLAPYFGVAVTPEQYERAVHALRGANADWQALSDEAWFKEAQAAARKKRFFHWQLEFPEIFFTPQGLKPEDERGFDAVVGNPPYGIVFSEQVKALWEARFPTFVRNNDIYVAFAELATEVCKFGGLTAMIVPNTFLRGPYFESLRRFAYRHTCVLSVLDFGTTLIFEDPHVFNAIFLFKKKDPEQDTEVEKSIFFRATVKDREVQHLDRTEIDIGSLRGDPWKTDHSVVQKMQQTASFALGDMAFVKDVGFNYWTKGRRKKRGGSIGSRVLYDGERQHEEDIGYLKGGDFDRYEPVQSQQHWLRHDYKNRLDPEVDIFRFSPDYLCVPKKIVYRQTSDTLMGSIDTRGLLVDKTVHVILLKEEFQQYARQYLLSILNSALANFAYADFAQEEGRTFAQVKIFNVKKIPIRRIDFTTPDDERTQLTAEGKRCFEAYLPNAAARPMLDFVHEQLTHEPERADVVHDLLAHLAGQMIEMSKEKHEEVQGFLKWLEREIGAAVDDLSGKTILRSYHDHDFDMLIVQLRKTANRRKMTVDPRSRQVQQAIEREFEASLAKLAPLKARLAATDDLIDLIVYWLYGLDEQEIALVEGNGG